VCQRFCSVHVNVHKVLPLFYSFTLQYSIGIIFTLYRVAEALIYGTASAGSFLAYAPDYDKGKIAGARIFKLLDRKPLIDPSPMSGKRVV